MQSMFSLAYDTNINSKIFFHDDLKFFSNLMNKLFFPNLAQPLPHPSPTRTILLSCGFVLRLLWKILFEEFHGSERFGLDCC